MSQHSAARKSIQHVLVLVAAFSGMAVSGYLRADVSDIVIADVTTRAFSVVWASDEPVADATVRVYNDAAGTDEVTSDLNITLISSDFPPALTLGVVKVDVTGLSANQTVFVETETTPDNAGPVVVTAPLVQVTTAAKTTKATAAGTPIVNDLILTEILQPDGVTAAEGTLLVLSAPSVANHPISSFVGDGIAAPAAILDMNNFFDKTTAESVEIPDETVLELTAYRGLLCADLVSHTLLTFKRAPVHEEDPPITELEIPVDCFFANTVCDETINGLDFQRVLTVLGESAGTCGYNVSLDISPLDEPDGQINGLDFQGVLGQLGKTRPFTP